MAQPNARPDKLKRQMARRAGRLMAQPDALQRK